MTQAATQITLSIAERVRDWSRQERDLAIAMRGLATFSPVSSTTAAQSPSDFAPSVSIYSSLVVEDPIPWTESATDVVTASWVDHESTEPAVHDAALQGTDLAHAVSAVPAPVLPEPDGNPVATFEGVLPTADQPTAPTGPFDEFIAALNNAPAGAPAPMTPLPPPGRFMVRVAPVGQPHRATKRNYDYFKELNARLAAQGAARDQSGPQ